MSVGEMAEATWANEEDIPVLFCGPNTKPNLGLEVEGGTEVSICKPFFFVDLSQPIVNAKRALLCSRYFLR